MRSLGVLIGLVSLLCTAVGAAGSAEPASPPLRPLSPLVVDPQFPAAWGGIWTIDTINRDCQTGGIVSSSSDPDTICAGDTFSQDGGFATTCNGTIDDTSVDVTCTGTFEVIPGCTGTLTYTVTATRSGNSFSGTGTTTIVYTGPCPFPDECTNQTITGTRTGSEPPECGLTPVLPASWGLLKGRYAE